MHKIIFLFQKKKFFLFLPYLKFSDLLPETHFLCLVLGVSLVLWVLKSTIVQEIFFRPFPENIGEAHSETSCCPLFLLHKKVVLCGHIHNVNNERFENIHG